MAFNAKDMSEKLETNPSKRQSLDASIIVEQNLNKSQASPDV